MSKELVPISLYDRGTPDPEKEAIVRAMLEAGRPQQFPPRKTPQKLTLKTTGGMLLDYMSLQESSWLILEWLSINTDWMQFPPSDWAGSQSFVRFKNPVDSLEVVNDCA